MEIVILQKVQLRCSWQSPLRRPPAPTFKSPRPIPPNLPRYTNTNPELGFSEMPANKYVESSFWNFDALFQPQMHPARDAHDTFFLSAPESSTDIPQEYMARVAKVHSEGGYGSIGYGYTWNPKEAQKLLLRTHTTAISSNMLYNLAQETPFRPVKLFSIDRVFRNETLDATHLAEFHQIEVCVIDLGCGCGRWIDAWRLDWCSARVL
jgi:phenylalanyl-tRNA synthetase alpha chain